MQCRPAFPDPPVKTILFPKAAMSLEARRMIFDDFGTKNSFKAAKMKNLPPCAQVKADDDMKTALSPVIVRMQGLLYLKRQLGDQNTALFFRCSLLSSCSLRRRKLKILDFCLSCGC